MSSGLSSGSQKSGAALPSLITLAMLHSHSNAASGAAPHTWYARGNAATGQQPRAGLTPAGAAHRNRRPTRSSSTRLRARTHAGARSLERQQPAHGPEHQRMQRRDDACGEGWRDGARRAGAESAPAVPRDWRQAAQGLRRRRRATRTRPSPTAALRAHRTHAARAAPAPASARARAIRRAATPAGGGRRARATQCRPRTAQSNRRRSGRHAVDVTARVDGISCSRRSPTWQPHAAAAAPISGIHACHARASPRPCSSTSR